MFLSLKRFMWIFGLLILAVSVFACAAPSENSSDSQAVSSTGPTPVVVRILNLDAVLSATPTPAPSATSVLAAPSPIPTGPGSTAVAANPTGELASTASSTPSCTNKAELVKHLSISPNSTLKAGDYFAKIWQIRNTGTCVWDTTYSLVFTGGEQMESPASTPLPGPVQPGETVDMRVNLVAPIFPGPYTADWFLQDGFNNRFGIGPEAGQPLQVVITIQLPPQATSG